jgi:hypothetical protein
MMTDINNLNHRAPFMIQPAALDTIKLRGQDQPSAKNGADPLQYRAGFVNPPEPILHPNPA